MKVRAVFVGGPEDGARMVYSVCPSHFHLFVAGIHGVYLARRTTDGGEIVFGYRELPGGEDTCPMIGCESRRQVP